MDIVHNVNVNTDQLKQQAIELNKTLADLEKRQRELAASGEKSSKVYQDVATQLRVTKEAIKQTSTQIDENTRALNLSKNSLQQNQAFLESLKAQYDNVTKVQGSNSKEAKVLNTQIGILNNTIEQQKEKLEDSRKVFDVHKETNNAFSRSFDDIKSKAGDFAPTLESASKGFNAMKSGLTAVKTGFQSVGGAIKTTGFGLLLLVLESVVEYFTKTEEGTKKLQKYLAGLKVIVDAFKGGLAGFGKILIDAFESPVKSIKQLGDLLYNNVINRFKAVLVIWEGIKNMDFKKISNGVLQAATGVTNLADKTADAYKKFGENKVEKTETKKNSGENKPVSKTNGTKNVSDNVTVNKARPLKPAQVAQDDKELLESQSRLAMLTLDGYSKEIAQANEHFAKLKEANKTNKATQIQLERERLATLQQIGEKFKKEDAAKLDAYSKKIADIQVNSIKDATDRSLAQLDQQTAEEEEAYKNRSTELLNTITSQSKEEDKLRKNSQIAEADAITQSVKSKQKQLADEKILFENFLTQQKTQRDEILQARADKKEQVKQDLLADDIQANQQSGHIITALKKEQTLLDMQHTAAVDAAKKKGEATTLIDKKYVERKKDLEEKLLSARIHAGDKYIDAVLKNSKKDSAIYKAAFLAKKATSIADVIISTKKSVIESLKAYSGIPFIGQALGIAQGAFMAGQGAMSIAEIAKQKPGFAKGGQFVSDGQGALLPGYSRTDNTNAYLRSGEAVVVSEAMRNPWARNLVSAINVAYGGRDFSIPNPGKGYAIGGIYTDGGNANRYYSQPVVDVKEMANTLAYQMINNFPPIYVDVKDVNNQQNILAQTVNRVNL